VRITDAALVAAATLSNRYITDRFLPDKAIDLIDEAASRLRIENDSLPRSWMRSAADHAAGDRARGPEEGKDRCQQDPAGKMEKQLAELKSKTAR
jgi:ATP-dependent Clp protease ATP-binding subunit ClpB